MKVAVAESVTGGAIMAKLVEIEGASNWFLGGVVVYQDSDKIRFGVAAHDIETHTSQSALVTESLAHLARERYGADIGLAITGNVEQGHAWVAKSTAAGMEVDAVFAEGSRAERIAIFRDAAIKLLQLP